MFFFVNFFKTKVNIYFLNENDKENIYHSPFIALQGRTQPGYATIQWHVYKRTATRKTIQNFELHHGAAFLNEPGSSSLSRDVPELFLANLFLYFKNVFEKN